MKKFSIYKECFSFSEKEKLRYVIGEHDYFEEHRSRQYLREDAKQCSKRHRKIIYLFMQLYKE